MKGHVNEGALRRALDEPGAVSAEEHEHLNGCATCAAALQSVRADRDLVAAGLSAPVTTGTDAAGSGRTGSSEGTAPAAAVDEAWRALGARLAAGAAGADDVARLPRQRPVLRLLRRPVVAVTAGALLVIGSTAAAASSGWLTVFKPTTVHAVTFDPQDLTKLEGLSDLEAYGTLTEPTGLDPQPAASVAAAAASSGLPAFTLTSLPSGVTGSPQVGVVKAGVTTFTFSAAKAKAAAAQKSTSAPAVPAGLDGARLRLDVGPGYAAVWQRGGSDDGDSVALPELVVVRMRAPQVSVEGATVDDLTSFLLSQPGLPADVARQLRGLVDGTVLPVTVPSDMATSSAITVNGHDGLLIRLRDGSGSAVVWIQDGMLQVVGGLLSAHDVQTVADELG